MTILRKFWGWGPSENSQRIFRKFWGWGSSENSEDSLDFFWQSPEISVNDNSNNHWIYPVFVSTTIVAKKKSPRAKSSTKHGPIVYTDNTQCVLLVLLFFPDHQSYIYFKIDQSMMIIIKCIWYSITRYIQRLSEWWTLANLILKGETNTKHAVILYTYSTRCLTCCVCLFFRAQNYLMHVAKMISW